MGIMWYVQGPSDGILGRLEGKGRHRSALAAGEASGQPLDTFVDKLNQIVAADYTTAAMQTPLDLCERPPVHACSCVSCSCCWLAALLRLLADSKTDLRARALRLQ